MSSFYVIDFSASEDVALVVFKAQWRSGQRTGTWAQTRPRYLDTGAVAQRSWVRVPALPYGSNLGQEV